MQIYRSSSEQETEEIGKAFARSLAEHDFVALYGEMGSGKTVFTRGFVSALIPDARVSSPTYAILNVYEGNGIHVNHFDLYRVTSEDDLASTGYDETIESGVTVCEWPEQVPEALPDSYWKITFSKESETGRTLTVERIGV